MPTVKNEFARLCATYPGSSIAAYLDPAPNGTPPTPTNAVLRYFVSTNARIPAAVYVLDSLGQTDSRQIFTNLPTDNWLWTYHKERFIRIDAAAAVTIQAERFKAWQKGLADRTIANSSVLGAVTLSGTGGVLPDSDKPIADGGLFAKAVAVAARPDRDDTEPLPDAGTGRDKSLERALRYYQLAAYALVQRAKHFGLALGNYVGALLVNDKGCIIGWGVNSALYHHAEVNLMLKYFVAKPGEALPTQTILFTTLTPCKQCINLVLSAKPTDFEIFYGQYDSGDFGQAGAANSKALDKKTKPVSVKKTDARPVVAVSLSSAVGDGSNIASRLQQIPDVVTLFDNVFGEIERKSSKERDIKGKDKPEDKDKPEVKLKNKDEQDMKKAVLKHIESVLGAIKI